MNVTKPHYVDIITKQGEPYLWGFPQPEAAFKLHSATAGYGQRQSDPYNKAMFSSNRPEWYPVLGEYTSSQFEPIYDPHTKSPVFYGIRLHNDA